MRRPLLAIALTVALTAACGSDGGGDTATTTTEPPDVTSSSVSTTTAATAQPAGCPDQPDSRDASPTPTQGATLADGFYFGYITFLDAEDLSLRFDVAQLLTGDAAAKAAAQEGEEANNDYWIRNNSTATRTLKLAEDATLCTATPDDIVRNREVSLVQLNQTLGDGEPFASWIDVRAGVVVRIQQQYFP